MTKENMVLSKGNIVLKKLNTEMTKSVGNIRYFVKLWSGDVGNVFRHPNKSVLHPNFSVTSLYSALSYKIDSIKILKLKDWSSILFYRIGNHIRTGEFVQGQKLCNFCSTYKTLNTNILPFLEVKSRYSDQIWLKCSIHYNILLPLSVQRIELKACICKCD